LLRIFEFHGLLEFVLEILSIFKIENQERKYTEHRMDNIYGESENPSEIFSVKLVNLSLGSFPYLV
jgi:DNA-binding sugar fermentation-stimulating protein